MDRRTLTFLAIAVSMLFGAGFTVIRGDALNGYAAVGGVLVALAWMAVGMLGRESGQAGSSGEPRER